MKNVEKIVVDLIIEQIDGLDRMLDLDGKFGVDIEMDSVDAIAILLAIEEKYGVVISHHEVIHITTPRELIKHLQKAL